MGGALTSGAMSDNMTTRTTNLGSGKLPPHHICSKLPWISHTPAVPIGNRKRDACNSLTEPAWFHLLPTPSGNSNLDAVSRFPDTPPGFRNPLPNSEKAPRLLVRRLSAYMRVRVRSRLLWLCV